MKYYEILMIFVSLFSAQTMMNRADDLEGRVVITIIFSSAGTVSDDISVDERELPDDAVRGIRV